jgi:hypothetical protein
LLDAAEIGAGPGRPHRKHERSLGPAAPLVTEIPHFGKRADGGVDRAVADEEHGIGLVSASYVRRLAARASVRCRSVADSTRVSATLVREPSSSARLQISAAGTRLKSLTESTGPRQAMQHWKQWSTKGLGKTRSKE